MSLSRELNLYKRNPWEVQQNIFSENTLKSLIFVTCGVFPNCCDRVVCKIGSVRFVFPICKNFEVYPNTVLPKALSNTHRVGDLLSVGGDWGPISHFCPIHKIHPLSPWASKLKILSLEIHSLG